MFIHLGTKKVILLWIHHLHVNSFFFFPLFLFESSPTHSNFESLKLPENREKLPVVLWIVGKWKKKKKPTSTFKCPFQFKEQTVQICARSRRMKSLHLCKPETVLLVLSVQVKVPCGCNQELKTHDVPPKSRGLHDRPSVFMCAFWCRPLTGDLTLRLRHAHAASTFARVRFQA